jgi:serine/threonine protein kinase
VVEEIGEGGMGKVYRVFDKKIHEMVALKIIKPEIGTDKEIVERFSQELKTARKIAHRNVCRMFDIGEEAGTQFITMEFVTGEDLRSLIKRIGQLTIGKTIDIAKQICEGLAEAHAMGIVHRDLKPQNIMIDREGKPKIMDFGIARFFRTKGVTAPGTIIGTPEYMSPEQAEGKEADQRSDLYSLGIILFEALTGKVPFEGDTPLSIAIKHKTETPPDPRKLNPQIPEDLDRLILKCLEKEKGKRYQTASEIMAELDKIEKGIPTTQRVAPGNKPLTGREITIKFTAKKLLVPAGVILALAGLAFGIWLLWLKPIDPIVLWNEGKKYWTEKKYNRALVQFNKLLSINSGHFEAQLSVAQILKEQGKADKAVVEYEKAIGLNKEDARAYKDLTEIFWNEGKRYWAEKKYDEALVQLKKLLALDSRHFEAQLSVAQILKEQGKAEEAIPEYEKAIGLKKEDPRAAKDLAEIFWSQGNKDWTEKKYGEALGNFKRLLAMDRGHFEAQLSIARILKEEGKGDEAVAEYEKAIGLKKDDLRAYKDLGEYFEQRQDPKNALKYFQEYLVQAPAGQDTDNIRQKVDRLTKSFDDTDNREKLKEKVLRSLMAAQNAFAKGNYQECLNQCLEVLKIDPKNAQGQELNDLAREKLAKKLATVEISSLVDQYVQSLANNNLVEFYKQSCISQLYQEISKDAELIASLFENFKPEASNKNIQLTEKDRAEVSFFHRLIGTSRGGGTEREISNGMMHWSL